MVTIWGAVNVSSWPVEWLALLQYSPVVIGLLGLFVSAWFNRIRPFLVILSIALLSLVLALYAPMSQESIASSVLFPVVSFLLPLNIFLWSLLPEKGVHHRGLNSLIGFVIVLQGIFVFWFMQYMPLETVLDFSQPVFSGFDAYRLPFISSLMFIFAGLNLSIKVHQQRHIKVFDHASIFVLLLMGFAINQYLSIGTIQWVSSMAMLMVMIALAMDAHHIAYTDELTGLKNRRALSESMLSLGKNYCIVMVDIDYFKQFNDTYGHDLGDNVLQIVASVMEEVGKGGQAYRFGGEEFTLVFKNKKMQDVKEELENLRTTVEAELIDVVDLKAQSKSKSDKASLTKTINVTVSMGVAQASAKNTSPDKILKMADEALYKAKKSGRNKVILS